MAAFSGVRRSSATLRGERPERHPDGIERPLVTALVIHIAIRIAVVAAVVIAAAMYPLGTGSLGGDVGAALGKSDGVWYLGIAHHGYGPPPPIGPDGVYTHLTSLAFFPLYPILIRAVAVLGAPYLAAALIVTGVAGSAAAMAIVSWARRVVGGRAAIALLVIWELLPSSVVLNMAYAEALFVAAAAGCLLALQRRRWLTAGAAAALGGLTRPTGAALVLAVAVAAFLEWRRRPQRPEAWGPGTASLLRLAAAIGLAAAGLIASLVHVAVVTGRVDGWFWLERTVWNSGFDAGWSALRSMGELVTGGRPAHRLPEIVASVVVVAAVGLAVWAWRSRDSRPDPPSAAYSLLIAVLGIGERGYYYVKPRLLFVAFPALTPVAVAVARQPRRRLLLAGIPLALLSCAYNAYLLVGWWRAL